MKWTSEAEAAIKKVPFFVRQRVRARVEKEAAGEGKPAVTLAEVKATQRRYLNNMEVEMRGYQLDSCFGPSGCPNRAIQGDGLLPRIQALLEEAEVDLQLRGVAGRREVGSEGWSGIPRQSSHRDR